MILRVTKVKVSLSEDGKKSMIGFFVAVIRFYDTSLRLLLQIRKNTLEAATGKSFFDT